MKKTIIVYGSLLIFISCAFAQPNGQNQHNPSHDEMPTGKKLPLDVKLIEQIIGRKGTVNGEEFKITVPQNDLKVEVDGFKIIPAMGLGTWIAFTPTASGAMVMGDIILNETDLGPVQRAAISQGLTISAIHNHFIRNHPNVMYMHIGGMGSVGELAQKAKAVLEQVQQSRGRNPSEASADSVSNTIDLKMLDQVLGAKGELSRGVYKYTFGRPDVDLQEHGVKISTFMGFNTWAAWQGSPEKAAVAGDFTMLENEVEPVINTLVSNGIEVVALHNHMVHEQPRIFFLHYWGVGPAEKLANALKQAINKTGRAK